MKKTITPITDRIKGIRQKLAEIKKLVEKAEQNKDISSKKLELTT